MGHEFKWISDCDLKSEYGENYKSIKIGIPQGGALSGFIANLVLDEVDTNILKLNDPDLLYLRYCDDMIMLHTNKEKLDMALTVYMDTIKKNKLFIHTPQQIDKCDESYYKCKSKKPYEWGDFHLGRIPWISFVGYQIGFDGEIRVRKSSIEKEIKKQDRIVGDAISRIKHNVICCPNRIIRSVIKRLQGMSIGYINLYYYDAKQSLCWANGFNKLNSNIFSKKQMRLLDQNRCKVIKILCKEVSSLKKAFPDRVVENVVEWQDAKIIYSGKPFSYFGWLEHKNDKGD